MESLLIKLEDINFIKKETPTQIFRCEIFEIFKNTYIQKYLLTTASDSPNPAYPFSSFFWQILSASVSTEYKVDIF